MPALIPVDNDPFEVSADGEPIPPHPGIPLSVLNYMAHAPSYPDSDNSIPRTVPPQYAQAMSDVFAQEAAARAVQIEGNTEGAGREDELIRQLHRMRDWPSMPPLNDIDNRQNSWRVSMTVPGSAQQPTPSLYDRSSSVIGPYLRDVASGQYLRQGLSNLNGNYDPNRSQYLVPVDHDPFQ